MRGILELVVVFFACGLPIALALTFVVVRLQRVALSPKRFHGPVIFRDWTWMEHPQRDVSPEFDAMITTPWSKVSMATERIQRLPPARRRQAHNHFETRV